MGKIVWIVEGLGDEPPKKHELGTRETVGELKKQFADKLGVSPNEIEVSTDTKRLTNESSVVSKLVSEEETLHIIPRAKGG